MTELVVLSGKGGTGKTSLSAAFAQLAVRPVMADCDVDAANLHLLLAPEVLERHLFTGGEVAVIQQDRCLHCGECLAWCRFEAVRREVAQDGRPSFTIDPLACEGCGLCAAMCPAEAVELQSETAGEWLMSETAWGPLVHAQLNPGGENSGKLVTLVRQEAHRVAAAQGRSLILVDGPPGIGCPVIASLTGADRVLVVTEPTPAGEHDLQRVLELAAQFGIPVAICVNKWDLAPSLTWRIESQAAAAGARPVGRIPYDQAFSQAQVAGRTVIETGAPVAETVREVWRELGLPEE